MQKQERILKIKRGLACGALIFVVAGSSPAFADWVELKRYSEAESLQISSGRSRVCGGYGFSSDRRTEIRQINCIDVDGIAREVSQLINPQKQAYQVRWSNRSPYELINGSNFFSSVGVSIDGLSKVLADKGGSRPIYQPVVMFMGRDPSTGDYLVPFCFSKNPGCQAVSSKIDGVLSIRRSASQGTYSVRDLGSGRQEYCILGGLTPRCDVSQVGPLYFGTPGNWQRDHVARAGTQSLDTYVIGISNYAKVPEAVRKQENQEEQAMWADFARRQRAADYAACRDYAMSGGITTSC